MADGDRNGAAPLTPDEVLEQAEAIQAWARGEIDRPPFMESDTGSAPQVASSAAQPPMPPAAPVAPAIAPAQAPTTPARPPATLPWPPSAEEMAGLTAALEKPTQPGPVGLATIPSRQGAPPAGPAANRPSIGISGVTVLQSPAERFGHRIRQAISALPGLGVSGRGTEQAKAKEAERAALAATATPVKPAEAAPETGLATATVERNAGLQNLTDAQDTLLGFATQLAATRGGAAPRRLVLAYQKALGDYNEAQRGYNATFDRERAALQGVQAAKMAAANVDAQLAAEYARNIRDAQEEKKKAVSEGMRDLEGRRQRYDAQVADIRERRVDPKRVFRDMNTGNRLLFIFASAADGFARGKGVSTQFWDNVNAVIDRDVEAQVGEISKRKGLLEDEYRAINIGRQHLTDQQAQIDAAYAASFEGAKALADGMKAKVAGTEQVAMLDQLIAQLDRQQKEHEAAMLQAQAQASLAAMRRAGAGGGGIEMARKYAALAKDYGDIYKQRTKLGAAPGADRSVQQDVQELQKRLDAGGFSLVQSLNRDLNELLKQSGGIPSLGSRLLASWTTAGAIPRLGGFVKNAERFEQLMKFVELNMGTELIRGVMTEKDQERFQTALANYRVTTNPAVKLATLNSMWKSLNNKMRTIRAGFSPEAVSQYDQNLGREAGYEAVEVLPEQ